MYSENEGEPRILFVYIVLQVAVAIIFDTVAVIVKRERRARLQLRRLLTRGSVYSRSEPPPPPSLADVRVCQLKVYASCDTYHSVCVKKNL